MMMTDGVVALVSQITPVNSGVIFCSDCVDSNKPEMA